MRIVNNYTDGTLVLIKSQSDLDSVSFTLLTSAHYIFKEKFTIRKSKKVLEVFAYKDRYKNEQKFREALSAAYPNIDSDAWEISNYRAYISSEDLVVWRLAYENRV